MTLSPKHQRLIAHSMETIDLDAVTVDFYDRFFVAYPNAEALFANTTKQRQVTMLRDSLRLAVNALTDDETSAEDYLSSLGVRHQRDYHVRDVDYIMFRRILINTLADHAGEAWSAEIEAAWGKAYEYMSDLMTG